MPIVYPEAPKPRPWKAGFVPTLRPGEGIRAVPLEGEILLDYTAPLGKLTGIYYSLSFQLPRWGFWRGKIEEWIFVSPVFREYYEITIRQREALEASIKEGLRSIGVAISDLELLLHDLRKYKEFLEYFRWIEQGKILIKKGKKKEGEELIKKGEQTLKAVFIDMVDAHTGPGIAMKEIAVRWPTIIADFMKLTDEDVDPAKIKEKLKVSEAEGVVLATKNKLYIEWKKLFKETVKRRYATMLRQVEARRKSVEEYKNMLRPTIARYKMIKDALENPNIRATLYKSFFRPEAQALSIDFMRLWAWKPFAPSEKYKYTKTTFDSVHAAKAGFLPEEIREIEKAAPTLPSLKVRLKGGKWDGYLDALPQEPSIDHVLREKLIPEIEKTYGVKFTGVDLFNAREMLLKQFRESYTGLGGVEPWVWSPYFCFLDIPLSRTVLRIPPAGPELEDIMIENLQVATETQNIILARCLEFIAKDKLLDREIGLMLGEMGIKGDKVLKIEEILKEEFPEVFLSPEEYEKMEIEKKKKEKAKEKFYASRYKLKRTIDKIRAAIGDFFKTLGWDVMFFRAVGPYEFAMSHRLAKYYQPVVAGEFERVRKFIETKMGVPGVSQPW